MLGYEPSAIISELEISDYAKCAFDMGVTPTEFFEKHNPMYRSGYELLRPYTTSIPCFNETEYQIVCINNSTAEYSKSVYRWQGTLHTATVPTPDENYRRVINSMMVASVPSGTPDTISSEEAEEFVATTTVLRRGYDKQHLEDDG